jgi:UPF0755 protein
LKKLLQLPLVRVAIALFSAFLITASLHEIRASRDVVPDFACTLELAPGKSPLKETTIDIPAGATGSQVAQLLLKAGVVASSEIYFRTAVADPRSVRVAPGIHLIQKRICAKDALEQLLDSDRIAGLINISEGMWISEIIPQMVAAGWSRAEVQKALSDVVKPEGFSKTEGLLFPAQYSFARGTTALAAVQVMVDRGVSEIKKAGLDKAGLDFSPQELLIIASLIQAEGNYEDFTRISQVVRNRLTKGMPLQFDSTVHYVKQSRGSVFLSTQSTLVNSPYNTYRRYGLPPGPINNPGGTALLAAVNPTPGDWIFFITVAPFDTRFTSDIKQFNEWKVLYKKNLRAGAFDK